MAIIHSTKSALNIFADFPLAVGLRRKGAIGQYHSDTAARGQIMCWSHAKLAFPGADAISPTNIFQQFILPPTRKVKGQIGHDEVSSQLRMTIIEKCVGVEFTQIGLNTANGKVHLRHLPGGGIGILPEHGNFIDIASMVFDKFCRLHKHTAKATAGGIHSAIVRLQDLYQGSHHARWRVKFPGQFAFLFRKFGQTAFVGAAQDVLAVSMLDHLDIGKEINNIAQPALVRFGSGKVFWQNVL